MKLTHWKLGTVLLGALVLLLFMWGPEGEDPKPLQPATTPSLEHTVTPTDTAPTQKERPVQRRVHDPECGTCPSMLATAEELKRSAPETPYIDSDVLDDTDCFGRLRQAAANGIANVSTQDLGGCHDRTPLHVASTPDQVRTLLEAGADVNAQDEYGHTALHSHAVPLSATEDSLEILELLLEAGADPRIENESGEAPWKHALLHSNVVPGHLVIHKTISRKADEEGLSTKEFLSMNPYYQERLDSLMDEYLIEALIQRRLLSAAVGRSMSATNR